MIHLKGITWDHPRGFNPLQSSIHRYKEAFGIELSWEKRTLKDFGDISVEELANRYDLIVIDHPHMGKVSETGCLINLKDYLSKEELTVFANQSVGPSFQSYNYNNGLWALPIDAACQTAAYRLDLLSELLLPETWSEVTALGNRLRSQKQFIGAAMCATDCNCIFLSLSAQFGSPVAQSRELFISQKDGIAVLAQMKALKEIAHPDSLFWNPIQLYDYMTTANDVPYSPLAFAYINYATNYPAPIRYTAIPGRRQAILGGAGMAVSATSEYINEAVQYTRWICDSNYQQTFYRKEGGQPGQLSAWTDKHSDAESGNFFSSVLPVIDDAYVRPQFSFWPPFQEWLGEKVHQFLLHNTDAEKLITELNEEYKQLRLNN